MTRPQKLLPTRVIASTREFVCECSRVFSSLTLASFDSRVGNASLACARTRSCLVPACDISSDASHSHSFVKLRVSGTVYIPCRGGILDLYPDQATRR